MNNLFENKKILILVIAILILGVSAFFLINNNESPLESSTRTSQSFLLGKPLYATFENSLITEKINITNLTDLEKYKATPIDAQLNSWYLICTDFEKIFCEKGNISITENKDDYTIKISVPFDGYDLKEDKPVANGTTVKNPDYYYGLKEKMNVQKDKELKEVIKVKINKNNEYTFNIEKDVKSFKFGDNSITFTQVASYGIYEQIMDNGTLSSTNYTTISPITSPIGTAVQLFRYTGDLNEPNNNRTNVSNEGTVDTMGGYTRNAVSNSSCGYPNMGNGLCAIGGVVNYPTFRTDDTINMTISAWVNYKHTGTGFNSKTVIAKFVGAGGWSFGFYENGGVTNPLIYFQYLNASGSFQSTIPSGTNIYSNQWYHVVMVTKSLNATTTSLEYYINGTIKKQENITQVVAWNLTSTAGGIAVGGRDPSTAGSFFNGSLDNVMLLNGALNSSQVLDVYTGNMQRYNSTRANSYVPPIAINGTDYLNLTYPYVFIPFNSSNNSINVSFATWNMTKGYTDPLQDNSLFRYFRFDKANPNLDSSNNSVNVTCTNCPSNSTGLLDKGEGYAFDGVNDILSDGTVTFPATMTSSVWFKTNVLNTSQIVFSSETVAYLAGLQLRADGKLTWAIEQDGSNKRYWRIEFQYEKDKWYNAIITQTSASATPNVYINGVLQSTTLVNTAGTPAHIAGTFYVGGYGTYAEQYFNGSIDELQIFNRVLNISETENLFFRSKYWNWTYTPEYPTTYDNNTYQLTAKDIPLSGFDGILSQDRIFYSQNQQYSPYIKNEYNLTTWTTTEVVNPKIDINWVYPISNINVTKDLFFNVTVNVSCQSADCGDINVTLDPITSECDPANGEGSQCSQLFVPSTSDPFTYSTGGYSGFCISTSDKTVYQIDGSFNDYGAVVDSDCDTLLGAGTGDCAFINDVVTTGDGLACPSYARKGSAVVSGDCVEVECMSGGSITPSSWFDLSNTFFTGQKGTISMIAGTTPFYTNGTNPLTINLNTSQSQVITWYVNATGTAWTNHSFFVYANQTANPSIKNSTSLWNVTIVEAIIPDTEYPIFSNFQFNYTNNTQYNPSNIYATNLTIINTNATAGIEFNGVNYSLSNISSTHFNRTLFNLGVGNYPYYYWAYGNGTNKNYNTTTVQYYTVLINSTYQLTASGTSPIDYGTNGDVLGSGCPNGLECNLFRDDLVVSNPDTTILGVGSYNYYYNSSGNQNYTHNQSSIFSLTVNQIASQTGLTFDVASPQVYGTPITPTCSIITGETTPILTINGNVATSGSPITLGVGTWNVTCTQPNSQNYTLSVNQSDYTITQASQSITPLLNRTNANLNLIYPSQVNASYSGTNQTDVIITIDGQIVTKDLFYTYGVGLYNVTWFAPSNQNFTSYLAQLNLTVNQGASSINLTLNGTQSNISINVGDSINLNTTLLIGDTLGTLQLWNNGTLINQGTTSLQNLTLFSNVGMYNITAYYLNSQNYTLSSIIYWVNVTGDEISPSYYNLTESPSDPATYSVNQIYEFNATWIDDTSLGIVMIEFNAINYTASNTGNVYNFTISNLGAGTYNYYWFANDSRGNTNVTSVQTYTINKANGDLNFLLNDTLNSLNLTFGNQVNASATSSNNSITLLRDGININSENAIFVGLGGGYYNYTAIANANQNFTEVISTLFVNMSRASSSLNLTLNLTQADTNVTQGGAIELNTTLLIGDLTSPIYLYNNGTIINSGLRSIMNLTTFNVLGLFNITGYYPQTQNYTSASLTYFVNVTAVVDLLNPAVSNMMPINNTIFNVSNIIEISANVTDNIGIQSVVVNITLPNLSSVLYPLSNVQGSKYNMTYVIPYIAGNYNVQFIATDLSNNSNSTESTNFTFIDAITPLVTINTPLATTYQTIFSIYNITLNRNGSEVRFTVNDGITNFTMNTTNNLEYTYPSFALTPATYTLKIFVNGSNNIRNDTTSVQFTIAAQTQDTTGGLGVDGSGGTGSASSTFTKIDVNVSSLWVYNQTVVGIVTAYNINNVSVYPRNISFNISMDNEKFTLLYTKKVLVPRQVILVEQTPLGVTKSMTTINEKATEFAYKVNNDNTTRQYNLSVTAYDYDKTLMVDKRFSIVTLEVPFKANIELTIRDVKEYLIEFWSVKDNRIWVIIVTSIIGALLVIILILLLLTRKTHPLVHRFA